MILLVGRLVSRWAGRGVVALLAGRGAESGVQFAAKKGTHDLVITVALLVAVSSVGIDINALLAAWIANPLSDLRVPSALRFAIDAAFRAAKIEIPFPQRDLHLRSGFEAVKPAAWGPRAA